MKLVVTFALIVGAFALDVQAQTKNDAGKAGSSVVAKNPAAAQEKPGGPTKEWKEAMDDWIVACVQGANGQKSCAMSQTLSNGQTRQVISVLSIGKDNMGKLLANIQAPLGFAVSSGLQLVIDTQPGVAVPVRTCLANGCLGILELDQKLVAQLQKATKVAVSMQSLQAQPVTLNFSAKGLAKAYDKLAQESSAP